MSLYFAGQMAGGLIVAVVLTSLLWYGSPGWPPSYGKAFYVSLVALALGVMMRAIGNADEGPPHVLESFAQSLIPQGIVMIVFLIMARRHYVRNLPYPELADSQSILKLNTPSHGPSS